MKEIKEVKLTENNTIEITCINDEFILELIEILKQAKVNQNVKINIQENKLIIKTKSKKMTKNLYKTFKMIKYTPKILLEKTIKTH